MSGNPFRRNAPGNVKLQAEEKRIERTPSPFKVGKKEKRVKIQTPPQSPEEIPRRLSAGRVSPPPPERDSSSDEESDTTATADSDIEQAAKNTRRNSGSLPPPGAAQTPGAAESPVATPGLGAPANPFARTLATSEAAFGLQRSRETHDNGAQSRPEGGKKGMDVDMFKNILMTGSPAPTPPQAQHFQDSSSNTDTSSVSKHSLFDQNYNFHPESPRSSFDHVDYSDDEDAGDEKGGLMGANKERLDDFAPPAPPKPGQAKLQRGPQTVSFADFDNSSPTDESASLPAQPSPANAAIANKNRPPMLHRTASDLNKPLPKTPPRSPGLPQETPLSMNTQVAQAQQPPTPTVTSPDETTKKAPPPPPTSRRAGQGASSHTRARSTSDTNKDTTTALDAVEAKAQETAPKSAAPPPPPSRKSKPTPQAASPVISTPVTEAPITTPPETAGPESKTMAAPPAPAPRRNPSTKTGPSVRRSPSSASHSSIPRHESANNSSAPPAPPPRRAAGSKRESLDGAPNSMTWAQQRRSSSNSFESARSGSLGKGTLPTESERSEGGGQTEEPKNDILADMTAFQAEIDALRKQTEGGG